MATLRTLIREADKRGRATASEGRWSARRDGATIVVRHHATDMVAVDPVTREITPISAGWGSMTDKCGIGRVLTGFGITASYASVFGGRS